MIKKNTGHGLTHPSGAEQGNAPYGMGETMALLFIRREGRPAGQLQLRTGTNFSVRRVRDKGEGTTTIEGRSKYLRPRGLARDPRDNHN